MLSSEVAQVTDWSTRFQGNTLAHREVVVPLLMLSSEGCRRMSVASSVVPVGVTSPEGTIYRPRTAHCSTGLAASLPAGL